MSVHKFECPGKANNALGGGVIASVILLGMSALSLAAMTASSSLSSQCRADCQAGCYSTNAKGIRTMCNGQGAACIDGCRKAANLSELYSAQWQCNFRNETNCETEDAAVKQAIEQDKECLAKKNCAEISEKEWAKVDACVKENRCDEKAIFSRGSGFLFMVGVFLISPLAATAACTCYKEAWSCSPCGWKEILGRILVGGSLATVLFYGVTLVGLLRMGSHPGAGFIVPFVGIAALGFNCIAFIAVAISRCCLSGSGDSSRDASSSESPPERELLKSGP
eukprot:TRINITY_DN28148_c0_g1_i1.p1 TRINITY_DN28148_c0_g1~~TRINITY_DN28148_c0_g1_i1.p1  ORF type:complete len:280 (-),score=42.15 TRINITY_DN28148_c0_g1_i1:212-1051(-)